MNYADYFDDDGLRSPFYRVSAKAIIRDDSGRVLVCSDETGTYELPGGGWEHGENFEQALRREVEEELGAKVAQVGGLQFVYFGGSAHAHKMLRIVADVELADHDFSIDDDEVTEIRFVNYDEFLALNWCHEDREIINYAARLLGVNCKNR